MPSAIKITRYGGIAPRFATELLPEGYAQDLLNAKLTSGDLVPYREPEFIMNTPIAAPLTIYPLVINSAFYWMMWTTDVDVTRSPVAVLTVPRFYFTGDGVPKATDLNRATFYTVETKTADYTQLAADYEKTIQWTAAPFTYNLLAAATAKNQFVVLVDNAAGSGNVTIDPNGAELIDGAATITVLPGAKKLIRCSGTAWTSSVPTKYPYDSFSLGLPKPTSAPSINFDINAKAGAYTAVAGDDNKTIDCSATPWTLSLTAAATLGADWMTVVRNVGTGDLTVDPNGAELINNVATIVVKSGEVGVIACNGTAFTGTVLIGEFKGYVYTWVSEWGEESVPSDSSNLLLHTSGQRVVVSSLPSAPPSGSYNVRSYNIYRTNTSDTGTTYQFVANQTISGTTTYNDATVDSGLGLAIESTFFTAPPTDLVGILNMANGMTAGFHSNEICFSEPYKPHAWPASYRYSVDFPIVAIGAIGNSLIVTTQGRPYIATGNHPSTITVYPLDLPYPCLSKRALVNMGTGIMYPSYEGLVFVSSSAPQLASIQLVTRDDWVNFYPTTMFSRFYDGKYFGNYRTPTLEYKSFIFQNAADRIALLTPTNIWATAAFSDPQTGEYFFVQNDKLYEWDSPDQQNSLMTWKSKDFSFPKPLNFGAARILGDFTAPDYTADNAAIVAANAAITDDLGYMGGDAIADNVPVAGDILENLRSASIDAQCLFQLYTDKALRWQRYVGTDVPFRLPTGYKTDIVAVQVSARFRIHGVQLAETPMALEKIDGA
jgi:hypothetical protein